VTSRFSQPLPYSAWRLQLLAEADKPSGVLADEHSCTPQEDNELDVNPLLPLSPFFQAEYGLQSPLYDCSSTSKLFSPFSCPPITDVYLATYIRSLAKKWQMR
jgi:hypothetical protein